MKNQSFIDSLHTAFSGFLYCLAHERNMKIHIFIAVTALFFAWYFTLNAIEFIVLVLTIGFVLFAEMINTALEIFTDLVSPGYHPLAGIIKNVAAGAVLLTAFISLVVGCILFYPKLFH